MGFSFKFWTKRSTEKDKLVKVRLFGKDEDIERFRYICGVWVEECKKNSFEIVFDVEGLLYELTELVKLSNGDVIVIEVDGKIVGFRGVKFVKSPLGFQWMASEYLYFVLPEYRGEDQRLIAKAREWAKDNRCSHLIFKANKLLDSQYDRVCKKYESIGLDRFETTYIERIGG